MSQWVPPRHQRWLSLLCLAFCCYFLGTVTFSRLWERHDKKVKETGANAAVNNLCNLERGSSGDSTITLDLGKLDTKNDGSDETPKIVEINRERVCFRDKADAAAPPLRFSRFLMFVSDCWPATYAKDLFDHYAMHSALYRISIPGAKHSAAVFSSYVTGMAPSTNTAGRVIEGDHLLRAIKRAAPQSDVRYLGPEEGALIRVLGRGSFDKSDFHEELEQVKHMHAWPYLFENPAYLHQTLNQIAGAETSVIAFSEVLDKRQHAESRGYTSGNTARMANMGAERVSYTMNTDMKNLKDWLEQHPEYLLILASDHGVDQFDHNGFRLHGDTEGGNEPFLMFFHKDLQPHPAGTAGEWIRAQDVAPTIASLLEGVDIPADVQGVTRARFGQNDTLPRSKALMQSVIQLAKLAVRREVSFDREMVARALSGGNDKKAVEELSQVARHLTQRVEMSPTVPVIQILIVLGLLSGALYYLGVRYNPRLLSHYLQDVISTLLRKDATPEASGFDHFHDTPFSQICKLAAIYSLPAAQLLFWWDAWGATNLNGAIFRIVSPVLVLIVFRTLRSVDVDLCTPGAEQDAKINREKERAADLVAICKSLLTRNEIINLVLVFLATCFPEFLAELDDGFPVAQGFGILVACWFLVSYALYFKVSRGNEAHAPAKRGHEGQGRLFRLSAGVRGAASGLFGRSRWISRLSFGVGIVCAHMYAMTKHSPWWYWNATSGMHVCVYIILVGCGCVVPLILLLLAGANKAMGSEASASGRGAVDGKPISSGGADVATMFDVLMLWSAVLYLISPPFRRSVLLLLAYQYYMLIAPAVECVRQLLSAHRHVEIVPGQRRSVDQQSHAALLVVLQCVGVYAINQAFLMFTFGLGDKLNFDLHPYTGKLGFESGRSLEQAARVDTAWLSQLSFVIMILHKYGPFLLCAGYTASLSQLHSHPDPVPKHAEVTFDSRGRHERRVYVPAIPETPKRAREMSLFIADHATATLILMELMCALGCLAMIAVGVTDKLLFEQAATTMAVCASLATINVLVRLSFEILIAFPEFVEAIFRSRVLRGNRS